MAFIDSMESERPEFALIGLPQAMALPAVQGKLRNLRRRSVAKHAVDRLQHDEILARIKSRSDSLPGGKPTL